MKAGKAWTGQIYDVPVQVNYTDHFIERFERSIPGRPSVDTFLSEKDVFDALHEAIPAIAETWWWEGDIEGLITSRSSGLNMSFLTREEDDSLQIVMKNMMLIEPPERYEHYKLDFRFEVSGKRPELARFQVA